MWLGIALNALPLLVVLGTVALLVRFRARVQPRYELAEGAVVVTYGRSTSDKLRLDRAARIARGHPLKHAWLEPAAFIDIVDVEGNVLFRFASTCISVTDLRALVGQLRTTHANVQIEPEVQTMLERGTWPRAWLRRLWPLAIAGMVLVFFVVSSYVRT